MTIIYQYRVATTSLFGFLKLLRAWKGSVYKLLYKELFIFLTLYTMVSLIYRFALTSNQRLTFEAIVLELHGSSSAIPLSFLLGFYVTFIVGRWWQQFINVPWPDRTLFIMSAYLQGSDDKARMMRRSVARYMLTGLILICRAVSVSVMKRFPTLDHIVDAGFITKEEKAMFEATECKFQKFWVPLLWANNILVTARKEGKIETDFGLRMIIQPLADFRDKCSLCFVYDWITVPLVYTQVVTFATHSYFAVSLIGKQYLDPSKNYKGFETDCYFPGFTILQFLFYMGWLKVAEQMINPFGEDDDDFDINWLLDRHTNVAFGLVDQCHGKHPAFSKDQFWNDVSPDVPYTESSVRSIRPNFLGSTFNIAPPVLDSDKMIIRDHDDINQNEWLSRARGRGSMTESLFAFIPFRHTRSREGSQGDVASNGSGHGRLSVPNGKAHYHVISKNKGDGSGGRRMSIDLPVTYSEDHSLDAEHYQLRERASTDVDLEHNIRERKFSLPFSIPLFSKNKQTNVPTSPNFSTRFSIEPVNEGSDSDGITSPKVRRISHCNMHYTPGDKVLRRLPVLSAIEEGGTVTSIRQIMPLMEDEETTSNGSNTYEDDPFDTERDTLENSDSDYGVRKKHVASTLVTIEETPTPPVSNEPFSFTTSSSNEEMKHLFTPSFSLAPSTPHLTQSKTSALRLFPTAAASSFSFPSVPSSLSYIPESDDSLTAPLLSSQSGKNNLEKTKPVKCSSHRELHAPLITMEDF